ncbi:concentrative nucleoside transporter, CNT family [Saccharopolyspora antimicrobica]|uniref:Nucleoside permease n=1 Tax=Saccharopolyspora antimicrobica TaxID=455193 RepID=A0A1I5H413_9PSEU|nr:NupC/NupG family nucleoside CNT transporter [Saccharopolyspora antimicrobica]RKT90107.1 CNT family concentrative nucleoside transporter [Saccharopolyspora antimicrobica]SFO42571.1 concentrative nucleoside transporter, CNT family [Saccharopolyspora antimicrobica]
MHVQVLWGIGGMLVVLLIAFAMSTNRRAINPRTVLGALAIQILFAFVVLRWDLGKQALSAVSGAVQKVLDSSKEGIEFMVGPILPTEGTVVAFQVLPIIVFISALTAVLYHWNILQWVVRIIGGGLQKLLGTTKPESLNATANIFLGMTEAPLMVRPYLPKMSRSEFFAVMTGGLATVAGTVMVGYAMLGASLDHLIAASFMAAPAGLLMAKIIMPASKEPETEEADAPGAAKADSAEGEEPVTEAVEDKPRNVIDAAASGASDGLKLALNVGAMLFAFISLIALVNLIVGGVGGLFGLGDLTLQQILGYVFSPLMWVIGVPWDEAVSAGSFLGQKLVLNEFVAFADFGPQIAQFSEKSAVIITFALTGFANLGSLGILLGGLGGMVPSKRGWIARDGVRAIIAGTLANLLSAAIAGILVA